MIHVSVSLIVFCCWFTLTRLTAVRGAGEDGDWFKGGEGIREGTWTTVWGLPEAVEGGGWRGQKEKIGGNCNSINNKIF